MNDIRTTLDSLLGRGDAEASKAQLTALLDEIRAAQAALSVQLDRAEGVIARAEATTSALEAATDAAEPAVAATREALHAAIAETSATLHTMTADAAAAVADASASARLDAEQSLDRLTADVVHQGRESLDTLVREAGERARHDVDAALQRIAHEATTALRSVTEEGRSALGGLLQHHRDELDRDRDHVRVGAHRLKHALEDVIQAIVSAVPHVGPLLAHAADRLDGDLGR
jgi:hypothetical protein